MKRERRREEEQCSRNKYFFGSPDFIRTQLHAKSVICSNRWRTLIGSLRFSVWDTLSLFQPQPKIIRRKEAKLKGQLSWQDVAPIAYHA
jgi:hypothetical protein